MQGRLEFGPRALGNRSLLASPLNPYSTENLERVHQASRSRSASSRHRWPAELTGEYFEAGPKTRRFLTTVRAVAARSIARPSKQQCWGMDTFAFHAVNQREKPAVSPAAAGRQARRANCPVLYNTSFNLFGDSAGLHTARRGPQLLLVGHRRTVRR